MNHHAASWQEAFCSQHRLGQDYLLHAQKWFDPLADALAGHQHGASHPLLVAVNGCQGSGKTTLCAYLCSRLAAQRQLRAGRRTGRAWLAAPCAPSGRALGSTAAACTARVLVPEEAVMPPA